MSKLEAFGDGNSNVTQNNEVDNTVENNVGNGLIYCIVYNAIFNSISVVQLYHGGQCFPGVLLTSISAQYSFQATGCFPT